MLLSLPYLPPATWLACLACSDTADLEACENYQKGSWRNRCLIAGPNGVQRLSVPLLKGKNEQLNVREVRIAYDEPWQQVHWRSIRTAYGNAPFFEHYADSLQPFYDKKYEFLFDFNLDLLHWLLEKFKIKTGIRLTKSYAEPGTSGDFRAVFSPKFPAPQQFQPEPYPQVFTERFGFLTDLSAIDLLFCGGPTVIPRNRT